MKAPDPFMTDVRGTGIQRGRGGFYRSENDTPWISDPSGELVKSGPRAGEFKRLMYGQPSNRGRIIENDSNLVRWGERRVVLGIGTDAALVQRCRDLTLLDVDSDEYKSVADGIIINAKDAAKAMLAADRGTLIHALTEDHDTDRDWVARAEAGEDLGIPTELQAALVAGWHAMLERNGIEILAVEASCVDDTWRLAGTLDRIARCTRPLRFTKVTGEIVDIPAGTVLVVDVKTGDKRLGRDGVPSYWAAYSIQIASYAQSVPYDTETETRGVWPWPIDQTHALIAHPDIDTCEWELIYVDLAAGRTHGGQCVVDAKAWEKRRDLFSVSQLDVPEGGQHFQQATTPPAQPSTRALAFLDGPTAVPPPDLVIDRNEGSTQGLDDAFQALNDEYKTLDNDSKAWLGALRGQAAHRQVDFHSHGHRSERRWWLIKALVTLAHAGLAEDEVLRALIALVTDDEASLWPAITPGYALGSLGARQAARLANAVDALVGDRLEGYIGDDSTFRLRRKPAA